MNKTWLNVSVSKELRRGGGGSGSRTDIGSEQDGDVLFEIEGAKTFDYVDGFIQTLRDTGKISSSIRTR